MKLAREKYYNGLEKLGAPKRWIRLLSDKGKSIRLGKVSQRVAESVKVLVEHPAASVLTKQPVDMATSAKVAELGDELVAKLASVGPIPPRAKATVGNFTEKYIAGRADLKPLAIRHLRPARRNLVEYLGEERPLSSVTPGDADGFRIHLIGKGFSPDRTFRTVPPTCGMQMDGQQPARRHEALPAND